MSMTVDASVNGEPIRKLLIQNVTEKAAGVNTYRWTCYRWTYADKTPDSKGIDMGGEWEPESVWRENTEVWNERYGNTEDETPWAGEGGL